MDKTELDTKLDYLVDADVKDPTHIIENDEPIIDETSVPDWEVEDYVMDYDIPSGEEELPKEEEIPEEEEEKETDVEKEIDEKETDVEKEGNILKDIGGKLLDTASEKVGYNLWDTIVKGV